ncbi:MAG: Rieske 2Fe-2S domain-containing protein [Gammaproteobacteria bacterium]|nr:Rieske 2Fe-2S domain-containing protein [Gammaproteobacteria bacterium]
MEQTLPSSWYLEQSIFELEREHIFSKEWVCVAREEELAVAGDHKVLDVYGESILLVRNQENLLHAFYNVCRHRGASLCPVAEQENSNDRLPLRGGVINGEMITCPYHAWGYDLDGQLKQAPHMTEEMGFRVKDIQLYKVGCKTWGGFIFINLCHETAPSFEEMITTSAEQFKRYPLSELRIGATIRYEVNANWKVLCENYNECYHCGPVHPELCQIVPVFKQAGGAELDWEKGIPHREGAWTFTKTGTTKRRSFPGLSESEINHHKGDLIYPNVFLSLSSDHIAVFILKAQSVDRTTIDCHFLFETFEIDKPDFDPADAVDFWHLVNRQDWSICERVQQGMQARVHKQGMFSPMEDWNLDIRRYVKDRIGKYLED